MWVFHHFDGFQQCLIKELHTCYQNPPKFVNPEDGNCKVHQNAGKTSKSNVA
jgi:hypothetical protein